MLYLKIVLIALITCIYMTRLTRVALSSPLIEQAGMRVPIKARIFRFFGILSELVIVVTAITYIIKEL